MDTPGQEGTRQPVMPPGEESGAPGALGVVEAFVNTTNLGAGPAAEDLADPETTTGWLRAHGLLLETESVTTQPEVDRAVRLREALRGLLYANHDDVPPPHADLSFLDREADRVSVAMRFASTGARLEPRGTGLDAAIATLLATVFDAMRDGSWTRLKACRERTCRWAMWDGSRNRSGKWCDMAVCGNRSKVRRFRERHAEA